MILFFRSKKSLKNLWFLQALIFCEDFGFTLFLKGWGYAESNPPPVSAAFIYAGYLCLIQDSSTAFALTSHEMAVSPFLLTSSAYASFSSIRRRFVSAPESCLSTCASRHRGSVWWMEFPQFNLHRKKPVAALRLTHK